MTFVKKRRGLKFRLCHFRDLVTFVIIFLIIRRNNPWHLFLQDIFWSRVMQLYSYIGKVPSSHSHATFPLMKFWTFSSWKICQMDPTSWKVWKRVIKGEIYSKVNGSRWGPCVFSFKLFWAKFSKQKTNREFWGGRQYIKFLILSTLSFQ